MGYLLSVSGIGNQFYIGVSSVKKNDDSKLEKEGFIRRYADFKLPDVTKKPSMRELKALAKNLTEKGIVIDKIASI